ncbi:uncharacterized protein MONOS_11139 [Monocercomonoides exilis]|uniref:uncharacterized protein n=1 Tax=Monocercomonoides exilis TaxID=2049356 RepID=UPI0035598604|nr:hypothetical protein MONOS_11139 [Monocercomonoides exilis]|eukprot:MONOS_11139.1-p1 / transcript=MONOS_11139.1 / gene=MONOS_11139 / organism=Monocercomonoides_exilis_PA203 / gene_product=unspecified product / transcript_product=unspecified product / location=Mono_scaffold00543:4122-4926(-) / protein_length=218 / sequence_SO=supercontig / SO=protein_coding / is_pseudo=false
MSTIDVDKSLDDMIKESKERRRLSRGGQRRESGASFSRRKGQARRNAKLDQLRGQKRSSKPKTQRNFGAAGLLQTPVQMPLMAPVVQQPPSVFVLPVATPQKTGKGKRNQSVLTKAQKRALSQEISKISKSMPVQFPTQMAAAPQKPARPKKQPRQRATSKVVQPVPAQPIMMIPPTQSPMYLVQAPTNAQRLRNTRQTRQPIRQAPRSRGRAGGRR